VANAERTFPADWIADSRLDVTDEFVQWAQPLIGDPLPTFADLQDEMAPGAGLEDYTPQGFRG
jgi:6-phosphofructokinase 1